MKLYRHGLAILLTAQQMEWKTEKGEYAFCSKCNGEITACY